MDIKIPIIIYNSNNVMEMELIMDSNNIVMEMDLLIQILIVIVAKWLEILTCLKIMEINNSSRERWILFD